jgi:hypothetical protein
MKLRIMVLVMGLCTIIVANMTCRKLIGESFSSLSWVSGWVCAMLWFAILDAIKEEKESAQSKSSPVQRTTDVARNGKARCEM